MRSFLAMGLKALEKLTQEEKNSNNYEQIAVGSRRCRDELEGYLKYLKAWMPTSSDDLPCPPPFAHRPERPVAWSAWWDAVERGRNRP